MKEITINIDCKYFNCDLEEFIAHLTRLKDEIARDYGAKANIEISNYEYYESVLTKCRLIFYREETDKEKQRKLDDERIAHRKRVQQEIETLQKLKEKYDNFNGDFDNYAIGKTL
jgi:hypothetical protein